MFSGKVTEKIIAVRLPSFTKKGVSGLKQKWFKKIYRTPPVAGFENKNCLLPYKTETVARRCSVKKVFLEISQHSQESTCARVSFLIKLQAWGLQLCLQVFSCEFCEISKNAFSYRTPPRVLLYKTTCIDTGTDTAPKKTRLFVWRCSIKKTILENSVKFKETDLWWSHILVKLNVQVQNFTQKRIPVQVFSC